MLTAPAPAFDATAFRRQFPDLAHTVFLASCSVGARSSRLDEALSAMLSVLNARSPWEIFEGEISTVRRAIGRLFNASPTQIALLPNASTAAYQVASGMQWWRRRQLVAPVTEFPGIAHVWLSAQRLGADVVWVGDDNGNVEAKDYLAVLGEATGLVSIPLISMRDGVRLPVAEIAAAVHAAGGEVFVDAYQAAGVEPVNVDDLQCDFLVAGFAKYLVGLPGLASVYIRSPDELGPPTLTGWLGRVDPFAFDPFTLDHPDEARRVETGTMAVPSVYAAGAGVALISDLDLAAVRTHVAGLVDYATDMLTAQGEKVRVPANRTARGAHVALVEPAAAAMARWLANHRVIVAPRGDVVRLAFHAYNTPADVEAACATITAYRKATAWTS
ncbi:aminotransferase class V-fold PLP-dependent enzyme [Micromonospora sp. CPCC 206061]|uniref:aminotransferase class V-fold PLP-dependent enzyme n=1 Tax=Micromonospora sp. CPCC 206061 TaxID=3122410 RepID=UPI002FF0CC42